MQGVVFACCFISLIPAAIAGSIFYWIITAVARLFKPGEQKAAKIESYATLISGIIMGAVFVAGIVLTTNHAFKGTWW